MEITVTRLGNSARVTLRGHIDEQGAELIRDKARELPLDGIEEVVIDFAHVTRIGSAGIGQLLLLYKNLAIAGGRLRVENLTPALYELFQGLKLDTLFTISR